MFDWNPKIDQILSGPKRLSLARDAQKADGVEFETMISVLPVLVRTTGVSRVVRGAILPNWVSGACDRAGLGREFHCVEIRTVYHSYWDARSSSTGWLYFEVMLCYVMRMGMVTVTVTVVVKVIIIVIVMVM